LTYLLIGGELTRLSADLKKKEDGPEAAFASELGQKNWRTLRQACFGKVF
jgi:hypothetical protein